MKGSLPASVPATLGLLAALAAFCQQVQASPAAECREEAELYGIPPEQFEDYVDGCVLSRGGYLDTAPDSGEAVQESAAGSLDEAPLYAEQPLVEYGEEVSDGTQ